VVGLVCCKNHIELKLMASPRNPLAVATTQNIGDLVTSLKSIPKECENIKTLLE